MTSSEADVFLARDTQRNLGRIVKQWRDFTTARNKRRQVLEIWSYWAFRNAEAGRARSMLQGCFWWMIPVPSSSDSDSDWDSQANDFLYGLRTGIPFRLFNNIELRDRVLATTPDLRELL